MSSDSRIRRALLFMPGDDLKKIGKGAAMPVDSVIMDIEDGVALNNKTAARQTIHQALTTGEIDFGATERLIRVNPAETGWQTEDIAATIEGKPDGYVLPKVESADEVRRVSDLLSTYEKKLNLKDGSIRLLAIIETAMGVVNLREIAGSSPRLGALMFGAEDLAGSIGAVRSVEGGEVFYAKSTVVIHAAAYGLQAIDTPYIDIKNLDGLQRETEIAMKMGYTGKMAIHPAQVAVIEEVYTPSDAEIEAAKNLIAAHDEHQASGSGVFAYQGKMVDMPLIRAAERVLARAKAAGKG